jgi:Domain of unknown function (DUF1993)
LRAEFPALGFPASHIPKDSTMTYKASVDGTEDKKITIKVSSGERKFTEQILLLNFYLPNFYFHYATASTLPEGMARSAV